MIDLDEIRSRINPLYADRRGSESHERKMLCDEIDSLRQQLADSEAERLEQARLLGMSGEREAGLLAKLAEKDAEIDRLKSIESIAREYGIIGFVDIEQLHNQLAASQAREQQLRYALDHYQHGGSNYAKIAKEALSLPQDTSALDQLKAQVAHEAGEVMRERCADVIGPYGKARYLTSYEEGCEDTRAGIDTEIRALPSVTLEDLK